MGLGQPITYLDQTEYENALHVKRTLIDQDVQHRLSLPIDYVICSASISFRRDKDSPYVLLAGKVEENSSWFDLDRFRVDTFEGGRSLSP